MYIREVSAEEYKGCLARHPHIYNTTGFAELNRQKVAHVRYLLFEDTKTRFGIILGEKDTAFFSPFSAPFGGFSPIKNQRLEYLDEAVAELKEYGRTHGKRIVITLPPSLYDPRLTTHTINVLSRRATLRHVEINYHFDLSLMERYDEIIERNAKKNLKRAMNEDFEFRHIGTDDPKGMAEAYDIIRRNREEHGYPLRMTLEDVMKTTRLIPADFFILSHEGTGAAAAQVFQTAEDIYQVIYWGDIRRYSDLRPMNRLVYHVFDFYNKKGAHILDIGPSTEGGVPNYGLCNFKESIGCGASTKCSFEL